MLYIILLLIFALLLQFVFADNFNFVKNSLYYKLRDHIEGKVILGLYKHQKILLERRLKHLVIQNIIKENEIKYT